MAPKKTDQKDLKEAQAATGEWSISKCSRHNLANLVLGGLLQERDLINWRLPFRDPFPMESVDEIVSFCSFFERGFALPTCSFFRGPLYFYWIELQHLNPNSMINGPAFPSLGSSHWCWIPWSQRSSLLGFLSMVGADSILSSPVR
jgi:hypothetical protein